MSTSDLKVKSEESEAMCKSGADELLSELRFNGLGQVLQALDRDLLVDIALHGAREDSDLFAHTLAFATLKPSSRPVLPLIEAAIQLIGQPGEFEDKLALFKALHPKLKATTVEELFIELLTPSAEMSAVDAEVLARYVMRRISALLEALLYIYDEINLPEKAKKLLSVLGMVLDHHLTICEQTNVSNQALSDFILELQLAYELTFTDHLIFAYAEILKDDGLKLYQKSLEKICQAEYDKFNEQYPEYEGVIEDEEEDEEEDDDFEYSSEDDGDEDNLEPFATSWEDEDEEEEDEDDELEDDEFDDEDDSDYEDEDDDDADEDESEEDLDEGEFQRAKVLRLAGLLENAAAHSKDFAVLSSILGNGFKMPEDYMRVAAVHAGAGDFEGAIKCANEGLEKLGNACPVEMREMIAELYAESGEWHKALEALYAAFEMEPSINIYGAMKHICLTQHEKEWRDWQARAISSLKKKLAADEETREELGLPEGNTSLVQLHALDEDYALAWEAAKGGCSVTGLLLLADRSLEDCFDVALPVLHEKVETLIKANDDLASQRACHILQAIKLACPEKHQRERFQQIMREIRSNYPTRHRLFKQIKKHGLW